VAVRPRLPLSTPIIRTLFPFSLAFSPVRLLHSQGPLPVLSPSFPMFSPSSPDSSFQDILFLLDIAGLFYREGPRSSGRTFSLTQTAKEVRRHSPQHSLTNCFPAALDAPEKSCVATTIDKFYLFDSLRELGPPFSPPHSQTPLKPGKVSLNKLSWRRLSPPAFPLEFRVTLLYSKVFSPAVLLNTSEH